jgi:Protein of unknown function (DUF2442)
MFKPLRVTPLPGFRILVEYDDGVTGEVDLSHLAGKGVFKLWEQTGAFERVTVADDGAIRWSDQVELCPDSLYLQVTQQSPEEAFPDLAKAGSHAGD